MANSTYPQHYTQTLLVFVIILKCISFLCHLLLVSTLPLFLLTSSHLLFSSQIQRAHFHEILFQSRANSTTPILHASQNQLNFVVFFIWVGCHLPPTVMSPLSKITVYKNKKATESEQKDLHITLTELCLVHDRVPERRCRPWCKQHPGKWGPASSPSPGMAWPGK